MKTKKTTLTVELEYDSAKTDPEGLASAMDRLLKTALSTPDILEEYGNPKVGEYFVASKTTAPPKPRIVLSISGGVLQEVFASDPTTEAVLVDWDAEGAAPSDRGIVEVPDRRTSTKLVAVREYPVLPWKDLPGTEADTALKAAGLDWSVEAGIATETQEVIGLKPYLLHMDGPLFRNQRQLLLKLVDAMERGKPCSPLSEDDRNLFAGIVELLDSLADQAHDRHGIDCLLNDADENVASKDDARCECESPGFFHSGVPGILAHMENGRLAKGAVVERCDLCRRYPSDEAAAKKLRELGHEPP